MATFHVYVNISRNSYQNEKFSNKSCRENQNTLSIIFFFKNLAGKEIMSKYTVKSEATGVSMAATGMLDLVRLYARKHTHAHPQPHTCSPYALPRVYLQKYVIPIAFPRQQWFVNAPECYILHTLPILFVKLPGFAHLSW